MTDEEKNTTYMCTIRDFEVAHKWPGGNHTQAFQVQEMGTTGEGSLEQGDALELCNVNSSS